MINYIDKLKAGMLAITSGALLFSCNLDQVPNFENVYLPDYEGTVALLIVNDTISFGDFLEENIEDTSKYSIDANQRILFSYTIETDFAAGDDFVEIDGFKNSKQLESPLKTQMTVPKDTVLRFLKKTNFKFPATKGEELDSVYFMGGDFKVTLNTSFPSDVDFTLTSSSFLTIAGNDSITVSGRANKKPSPPTTGVSSVGLNGYKSKMTSASDSNVFVVYMDAKVYLKQGDILSGREYVNFALDIVNPDFDVIFGYFDQDTFSVDEKKVDLDFFKDLGGDGIEFEAPTIDFTVSNSFGLPMGIDFSKVYATYEDADDIEFSGSFADNPQLVAAPTIQQVGNTVSTTLTINGDNSNLREILSASPKSLVLPLAGYSNLNSTASNFLSKDSKIDINAKVTIPLKLKVDNFEYSSTIDLEGLEDLDGTKELSIVITTINELPFDGSIDLIFQDKDKKGIDSLMNQSLFVTPTTFDNIGKVSAPSENRAEIKLDQDLINSMISADKLKVVVKLNSFNSSGGNYVEVFADYDLMLKVGIAGSVKINLNGN